MQRLQMEKKNASKDENPTYSRIHDPLLTI